jgi:flagellar assembly protein FliH
MAGIIKAAGRVEPRAKAPVGAFHFDDVGQSYIEVVRTEAARIVSAARQEAAAIRAKATEEGRQAALEAAQATLRTKLDQQLVTILAAIRQAVQGIEYSRQKWQQHWEQHVVELGVAIASRLCRRELSREPAITVQWVRESLEMAAGNAEVVLRLNPDDHQGLKGQIEAITRELTGLGNVRMVADGAIAAGGCRVETEFGSLDQQLEQQLDRIAEELLS